MASLTASYLGYLLNLKRDVSLSCLSASFTVTRDFFRPLIDAFVAEGYVYFQPPCFSSPSSGCFLSSVTTPAAQRSVCDLPNVEINVVDQFVDVSQFYPVDYLPSIENSCPSENGCVLNMTTYSENYYENDNVSLPLSAYETAAKMKSRQACWIAAGIQKPNFDETDLGSLCAQYNEKLYIQSVSTAAKDSLNRFRKYGIQMVMSDDIFVTSFPNWSKIPMNYTITENSDGTQVLSVTAVALATKVSAAAPGYHFCTCLSPARVLEWVYVDSLRIHYSLGSF